MAKIIDARGLSCPQPVILTKKGLEECEQLTTIVDNPIARENVKKLAGSKGCTVQVEEKDGEYYIHISKGACACQEVVDDQKVLLCLSPSNLFGKR